jgi:hypothetical protein
MLVFLLPDFWIFKVQGYHNQYQMTCGKTASRLISREFERWMKGVLGMARLSLKGLRGVGLKWGGSFTGDPSSSVCGAGVIPPNALQPTEAYCA